MGGKRTSALVRVATRCGASLSLNGHLLGKADEPGICKWILAAALAGTAATISTAASAEGYGYCWTRGNGVNLVSPIFTWKDGEDIGMKVERLEIFRPKSAVRVIVRSLAAKVRHKTPVPDF